MTSQEEASLVARLERYRELVALRDKYRETVNAITRNDPDGPFGQGPFTGNTRESRRVDALIIDFSRTRGGDQAVTIRLQDLGLEAFEFASYLRTHLNKLIKEINDELDAL